MDSLAYFRFLIALLFVLALIAGCAWAARRFGLAPRATVRKDADGRRLAILEVLPIDARRRAILLRRDDVEHLILIGEGETVIERGISRAGGQA